MKSGVVVLGAVVDRHHPSLETRLPAADDRGLAAEVRPEPVALGDEVARKLLFLSLGTERRNAQ